MIDGREITLGGKVYVLPPLNFAALRRLAPKIQEVGGAFLSGNLFVDMEKALVVSELVHAALKRNYPEITLEEVEEAVDFDNIKDIFPALMGVSGLEFKEGQDPGEARPVGDEAKH